jgi:hypothetical protein
MTSLGNRGMYIKFCVLIVVMIYIVVFWAVILTSTFWREALSPVSSPSQLTLKMVTYGPPERWQVTYKNQSLPLAGRLKYECEFWKFNNKLHKQRIIDTLYTTPAFGSTELSALVTAYHFTTLVLTAGNSVSKWHLFVRVMLNLPFSAYVLKLQLSHEINKYGDNSSHVTFRI